MSVQNLKLSQARCALLCDIYPYLDVWVSHTKYFDKPVSCWCMYWTCSLTWLDRGCNTCNMNANAMRGSTQNGDVRACFLFIADMTMATYYFLWWPIDRDVTASMFYLTIRRRCCDDVCRHQSAVHQPLPARRVLRDVAAQSPRHHQVVHRLQEPSHCHR